MMKNFINRIISKIEPLRKIECLTYWKASITGDSKYYNKLKDIELKIKKIFSNKGDFNFLKENKEKSYNTILKRQVDILYNKFLKNQTHKNIIKEMTNLSNDIQKDFSTFRSKIGNRSVTDNQIKEILKTNKDSIARKAAWEAGKKVGEIVENKLLKLIHLRNKSAKKIGFNNYHELSLSMSELNVPEMDIIFKKLFEITNEPFKKIKSEIDHKLSKLYSVDIDKIMPWHYHDPFFQEFPSIFDFNLDSYFEKENIINIAIEYFKSIGFDISEILEKSDLFEKNGKIPHAYCINIDHEKDIRILCNIKNNHYWMETLLHELGHAVYYKYIDNKLPFLLKEPSHIFTTEAAAMFFGRLGTNHKWMNKFLKIDKLELNNIENISNKVTSYKLIIFIRWALVMWFFEKELYSNPNQDLNNLWWDIVGKIQFLNKPVNRNKPDWASKVHFTNAPCYYHNYILGELLASQIHYYLKNKYNGNELYEDYLNSIDAAEFLKDNFFNHGALYRWDNLIKNCFGESLNPDYFIKQFSYSLK